MALLILYFISFLALLNGLFAIFTLVEKFPVSLLYYHARMRKIIAWFFFASSWAWILYQYTHSDFSTSVIPALFIISLSVLMTYKVHQDAWFKAVDFPKMSEQAKDLPIKANQQLALIEIDGILKAYPLDYVIHHHIINDRFGDKIIALTYCAVCRSIIPFDVTSIGRLYVGSFKHANMIAADRKTGTFFQQETAKSTIGKLHPTELQVIPFQILTWEQVQKLNPMPQIPAVTDADFKPFSLPVPGVWKKVMSSELTPGLKSKDTTLPSKTRVIGITDSSIKADIAYLKTEVLALSLVRNDDFGFTLIGINGVVNAFKNTVENQNIRLSLRKDEAIIDILSGTQWDMRGKYINGSIKHNLEIVSISDEYWFARKQFYPETKLITLDLTFKINQINENEL